MLENKKNTNILIFIEPIKLLLSLFKVWLKCKLILLRLRYDINRFE